MSDENKKEVFEYTYSAKQQEEVKLIREKYVPREADKLEQLRRLDASVTQKGTLVSLIVGITSSLVLGVGMCCCMVWNVFVIGVLIGIIGIAGVAMAYPIYAHITKKERERLAPEILRLSDELMR